MAFYERTESSLTVSISTPSELRLRKEAGPRSEAEGLDQLTEYSKASLLAAAAFENTWTYSPKAA